MYWHYYTCIHRISCLLSGFLLTDKNIAEASEMSALAERDRALEERDKFSMELEQKKTISISKHYLYLQIQLCRFFRIL